MLDCNFTNIGLYHRCFPLKFLKLFLQNTNERLALEVVHTFFISNSFFQLRLSVAYVFQELSFKCCYTYNHHLTVTIFFISIFVPMSRPAFIYVVFM